MTVTTPRLVICFLFAALVLGSCSNVTFTEPMPLNRRDLPKFPPKWRGGWTDSDDMVITIGDTYFEGNDLDKIMLSENVLLRRFHGHLVLNQPEENGEWSILLGRRWKDELKLWTFDGSEDSKVAAWAAVLNDSSITEFVSDEQLEVKSYVLDPENNAAFRKLITEGGLTESYTLQRVNP
ncbi:MAG: hypothetical protein CL828_02175 [Crocinitomicaceae bacterium]|nr:hypothetical protein [Crocinitomicaceae bacterium]